MALPAGVAKLGSFKGVKGDRGTDGKRGPKGSKGDTGTFASASAVPVGANEPARAVVTGPESARHLTIYVPRGFSGLNAVPTQEAIAEYFGAVDSEPFQAFVERSESVSPMWFGAVGDGVADDRLPLQAAIDHAGTKPVLIDKPYRISAPVLITEDDQEIRGAGGYVIAPEVELPEDIGDGVDIFRVTGERARFDGVRTKGGRRAFQFGTEATWPNRAPSGHGGLVVNCRSESPSEMVRVWYADDVKVINSTGTDIREYGVTFWGGPDPGNTSYPWPGWATEIHSGLAQGNTFVGKLGDGSEWEDYSSGGIWTAAAEGVVVSGNTISTMGDVGVDFETSRRCVASQNTILNIAGGGLGIFFSSEDCVFDSNVVTRTVPVTGDRLGAGFWLAYRDGWPTKNIRLSNNVFVGCGILFEGVMPHLNPVVESNQIRDYPTNHLWMQGVIEPVIRSNKFDGGTVLLEGCQRAHVADNDAVSVVGGSVAAIIIRAFDGGPLGTDFTVVGNRARLGFGSTAGAAIAVNRPGAGLYGTVANNYVQLGVSVAPADATTTVTGNIVLP